MDTTLQTPGTKRVFPMPQGLKELASDISKAVIQNQPENIYKFIANYINSILVIREKTREAAIIVHDLLHYELTYEKMLTRRGVYPELANRAATIIQASFRGHLARMNFELMKPQPEVFEIELYLEQMGVDHEFADMAATKIQAYYRGYKVRRVMWEVFGFSTTDHVNEESRAALQRYLAQLGITYSTANKAAWKIQRFYRDYRKKSITVIEVPPQKILSNYRTDSDSEDDDKKAGDDLDAVEMELPLVLPQEGKEDVPVAEPAAEGDSVSVDGRDVEVAEPADEGDNVSVDGRDVEVAEPAAEGDSVSVDGRDVEVTPPVNTSEPIDDFSEYATETTEGSTVTDWDGNLTDTDMSEATDHEG